MQCWCGSKVFTASKSGREAGNCQVCMWILERWFPEDYGRREYRRINKILENKNENVEIIVKNGDEIRKQILAKSSVVKDRNESSKV